MQRKQYIKPIVEKKPLKLRSYLVSGSPDGIVDDFGKGDTGPGSDDDDPVLVRDRRATYGIEWDF